MDGLDELRLKIAKAKGYYIFRIPQIIIKEYVWVMSPDGTSLGQAGATEEDAWILSLAFLPNWPRDIAAAFELENEIPPEERPNYEFHLIDITQAGGDCGLELWALIHATPEQRCRAYLAWKEAQG